MENGGLGIGIQHGLLGCDRICYVHSLRLYKYKTPQNLRYSGIHLWVSIFGLVTTVYILILCIQLLTPLCQHRGPVFLCGMIQLFIQWNNAGERKNNTMVEIKINIK